ncbi:hypothetical protein EDB86DRAFT_3071372 [Lactarius hatsudake]|nr:hypothetical protein EDB86DRAFT_3071372 [Lactarius hatsudake]
MPEVEKWVQSSDWSAPLVVTVVCLLLVNQRPSLVDDCPYFEEAIAFSPRILTPNTGLFTSVAAVTPGAALDPPAAIKTWVLFVLLNPVRLPHRRHYMPATEYVHGPPHTLRAVPSMIDLGFSVAEDACGASERRGSPSGSVQEKAVVFEEASEGGAGEDGETL